MIVEVLVSVEVMVEPEVTALVIETTKINNFLLYMHRYDGVDAPVLVDVNVAVLLTDVVLTTTKVEVTVVRHAIGVTVLTGVVVRIWVAITETVNE